MKPIIVGLAPGSSGSLPLDPAVMAQMDLINLHSQEVSSAAGIYGRDRQAADNIRPMLRGRRVIALGRRVSYALGMVDDPLAWRIHKDFIGATVPHPGDSAAQTFLDALTDPCVHIEGPDGAGKSTLVGIMSENGLVPVSTQNPPKLGEECIFRIEQRLAPGTVCDRSSGLVSELVYGPVLRGRTIIPESTLWAILDALAKSVSFVYCRPPDSELVHHDPRPDEDPEHVKAVSRKRVQLINRYDEVFRSMMTRGCHVIWWDRTSTMSEKELLCAV